MQSHIGKSEREPNLQGNFFVKNMSLGAVWVVKYWHREKGHGIHAILSTEEKAKCYVEDNIRCYVNEISTRI